LEFTSQLIESKDMGVEKDFGEGRAAILYKKFLGTPKVDGCCGPFKRHGNTERGAYDLREPIRRDCTPTLVKCAEISCKETDPRLQKS
jgi:hypothetical protein